MKPGFRNDERTTQYHKLDVQEAFPGDLNDMAVVEGQPADLDPVFQRFEKDFPSAERMERSHLEWLLSQGSYRMLLAQHRGFDALIGYAFVYEPETPAMIWLDYMAIDERFQNAGYGTFLFHTLALRRPDGWGVFVEVEIADSPDPTTRRDQERRIAFYQRLGAHILPVPYRLPTEAGSLPMHLVFWPAPRLHILRQDQIKSAVATAYADIHSDIPHRDRVLKSFASTIHDAYF
jgi:GNAT superfamily N-acetyltransferase